MSNSEHFHSNIDSREYRINYSFNCDSSNVVYLLECTVCGVQYVGSTCTPFRLGFNNYKACSRKFNRPFHGKKSMLGKWGRFGDFDTTQLRISPGFAIPTFETNLSP